MAHQRILKGGARVEIAAELNCSQLPCRQFGAQKERAQREPVRSPLRFSPAEREEISRGLQAGAGRGAYSEVPPTPNRDGGVPDP